jgi:hypothetical protein
MTRRKRWLAAGLVAMSAALVVVGVSADLAIPARPSDNGGAWTALSFVTTVVAFSVVGGLIALRRPGNPIGWLLAAIGLLFAVVVAFSIVTVWGLRTGHIPKSVAEWIGVGPNVWVIALGLIGTQLPLRLPDGRLPSPRWTWFSRASIVLIAVTLVGMATIPGRVEDEPGTANPLGAAWARPLSAGIFLLIACFIVSIVGLFRRYRRSDELDRAQLRWIAFGGGLFLAVYLITIPLPGILRLDEQSTGANLITTASQVTFAALPIAIGYAILRHRLYDIDMVINRALVYGTLTAILAATYAGSVLFLQLVLSPSSNLAIAASTLAVAGLFYPARARVQMLVDRRFFRRRYDAQRTVDAFTSRLRDELELAAVSRDLRDVVIETLQPAHVSLWLREQP